MGNHGSPVKDSCGNNAGHRRISVYPFQLLRSTNNQEEGLARTRPERTLGSWSRTSGKSEELVGYAMGGCHETVDRESLIALLLH